jgi:hypothetical protein
MGSIETVRCDQVNVTSLNEFLMHGCKKDETKNGRCEEVNASRIENSP